MIVEKSIRRLESPAESLPAKTTSAEARQISRLVSLNSAAMIFYESPYRLVKTLTQFVEYFGAERQVSVCREISKIHEESVRGTLQEVIEHFKANEPRGEIVIILSGKED